MQTPRRGPILSRRELLLLSSSAAATLLFAGGCGGSGTITAVPNTKLVGPDGMTVRDQQTGVALTFPAGLFDSTKVVRISQEASAPDLTPLTVAANGPTYLITFSEISSRAQHRNVASSQAVLLEVPLPDGIDTNHSDLYLYREDSIVPFLLGADIDQANKKMRAIIPIALLDQSLPSDLSKDSDSSKKVSRDYDTSGFTVISHLRVGVTVIQPDTSSIGAASVAKKTYNGLWINDNWSSVNNIGVEKLPGKRIAVVVHGTWASLDGLEQLSAFLLDLPNSDGTGKFFDQVIGIDYDSLQYAPSVNGALLADALIPILNAEARVFMFAHSQGGLVTRWAIEKAGASKTVMLVQFGTPNDGIPSPAVTLAALVKLTNPLDAALVAMAYKPTTGERSSFLKNLNATPTPGNAAYYTVTGDVDLLSRATLTSFPEDVTNILLKDGELLDVITGGVIGDDGVVYLESSRMLRLGFSQYCRGGYPESHNITLDVAHTHLYRVNDHPEVGVALTKWIYDEGYATTNIGIS